MKLAGRAETALGIVMLAGAIAGFAGVVNLTTNPYSPLVTTAAEQRAADMGIAIVVTDDERNCGATRFGEGGCFSDSRSDTIYVSPTLAPSDYEYIVLHELAHVQQHHHGPADECAADRQAAAWGAVGPFHYCDPE